MNFVISLAIGNVFYHKTLKPKDSVTVGSSNKDEFYYNGYKAGQITIKNKGEYINAESKSPLKFEIKREDRDCIIKVDESVGAYLFISPEKSNYPKQIELPHNGVISIGRSVNNNIVINNRYVSSRHCIIRRQEGVYYVEDANSSNGTYLNRIKVTKSKFETGDVIHIFNYSLKLDSGKLTIENAGMDVSVKNIPSGDANEKGSAYTKGERPIYYRSPRTQEEFPKEDIVLASPPSKGQKFEKGHGMFTSLASSAAMMGSSLLMGGGASAAMLAARSTMLIMPATSIASQKSRDKKSKNKSSTYEKLRELRFADYLNEQRTRIYSVAEQQRKILTDENPSPADCLDIVNKLNRNLWERTPADRDFLDVRLGMGYEKLCVNVKDRGEAFGIEMEDDDAKEMSAMLVEESKYVDNVPVRVSLAQNATVGVIGDREKVINQVKNMIAELTTFHCYTDVKVVGIFDNEEYDKWEDLRWLPHCWDDNKQTRFLAFNEDDKHAICEMFDEMLKTRERELNPNSSNNQIPIPYYIFIIGSKKMMENEDVMANLVTNNPLMGVTSLFLFNDIYSLPNACNYIIDMQEYPVAYWRDKVNSKFIFTQDKPLGKNYDNFSRRMSAIELKGFAVKADIPSSVTFLQGYGVKTIEELDILNRWNNNYAYKSLAAPIGVLAGEKVLTIDIHDQHGVAQNVQGPHGLVAGTTGSGKSELLQTWILSVCVNYHPHDVNFVLIDYKGGGMANTLEDMPHVVGKITNIGTNIQRSITSLKRENNRRQELFAKAEVNHIDDYQKLYYEGKVSEPLPHLIIVADEFAELKKENPEFIRNLVSISVIGRSLGMHLVLATQKPSGIVDDQIEANTRMRLCLKVQDAGDSREMLKTPDAAMITQAGRAYVKIGNFEYYEQFQSYWSGATYYGNKKEKISVGNQVKLVNMNGTKVKTVKEQKVKNKSDVDELKAINMYICKLAEENGIKELQGPWLPELEEYIDLDDVLAEGTGFDGEKWNNNNLKWLEVPIGKYDRPELQDQGILCLDFQKDGHYGIYGTSSTGKTTLLKTMLSSICRMYSPDDVNIYAIDCGGWSMSAYSNMPHVGDVILDTEEEKFIKFKALIDDIINERKRLFHDNVVSSLSAYRQSVGNMPAIIIAIDNIVPIFDLYPDMEDTFIRIAREGTTYGIYMIYTANSTTGIRFKVLQNIKGAVAFELTDRGDYPSIVGRMDGKSIPKNAGRALFKESSPLEFQTAMYANGETDIERVSNIKALCNTMSRAWKGTVPKKVPIMSETVSFEEISSCYSGGKRVPVGVDFETIETSYLDMNESYCAMITGPISIGKSAMLCNIIKTIDNEDNMIYLFDSAKGSFAEFSNSYAGYAVDNDEESVASLINEIVGMLNVRQTELNNARLEDPSAVCTEKHICIFIDDINEYVNNVETSQRDMMNNIARLAKDLNVMLFAAGRIADVTKLADIEPLTSTIIKYQNGIAISGTPAQYSFFRNTLSYAEKDIDCEKGNAWSFHDGSCRKIKIV